MPVQYTPQFIPTDVNLMNQMLNQKQQEHDMSLARIAETEDKFGQMRVDPSDIGYKNQLLSGFQDEVQKVVDQYDGDYGAASKDITRKLTKFRNDPFFQNAPYKAQLIEEARKREAQLGYNAIDMGRGSDYLRGIDISKQIDPEDFKYDILDRRDLQKDLSTEYGHLGRRTEQMSLQDSGTPGYLKSRTYKGLYKEDEINQTRESMANRIMQMNPDMNPNIAMQEAENFTNQLVQGYNDKHVRDLEYKPTKDASEEDTKSGRNYILSTGKGSVTGMPIKEIKESAMSYKDAVDNIASLNEALTYMKTDEGRKNPGSKQATLNLSNELSKYQKQYDKAFKQFEGPMLTELMDTYKIPEAEALAIVAAEKGSKPITHATSVRPSSEKTTKGIISDLNANLREIDLDEVTIYDNTGGKKTKSRDTFEKSMKEDISSGNIQDVKINVKSGEMKLISKTGESYGIPITSLSNKSVSKNLNGYNKLMSTLNSGASKSSKKIRIGDNDFISSRSFNQESGLYENVIYLIDDENMTKHPIPEEQFNDVFFTELFSTYGQEGEYKPTYLN